MDCHAHRGARSAGTLLAALFLGSLLLSSCGGGTAGSAPRAPGATVTPRAGTAATITALPDRAFMVEGTVEQLTGQRWVVAGIQITLDTQTVISGTPALGAFVRVEGEIAADGVRLARMITVEPGAATSTPAATPPAASTATPPADPTAAAVVPTTPPAPTAPPPPTPLPVGTQINVTGVIQNIVVNNNVTVIAVNNVTYILPPNFKAILAKQLRTGVPIVFVGQVEPGNQITIINVTQINNQVIVVEHPGKKDKKDKKDKDKDKHDDKEDQDDD